MMDDMLDTQDMKRLQFTVAETRTAVCPTCGDSSQFTLCGIQEWPPRVAEAAGMPTTMSVWSCDSCETTLLEANLHFDD
jgi:hypothetical protein